MQRLLLALGLVAAIPFLMASDCSGTQAPASAPAPRATLLDLSGSRPRTTSVFVAPSNWNLVWSYDCTRFGTNGHFSVEIDNAGDSSPSLQNKPIDKTGAKDNGSQVNPAGGSFYLKITSECNWTVKVTG